MTPYILMDREDVSAKDALKISMEMTYGHKAEIFVMILSFIGRLILSGPTFGILAIFYTGPYISTSFADLYEELKQNIAEIGRVLRLCAFENAMALAVLFSAKAQCALYASGSLRHSDVAPVVCDGFHRVSSLDKNGMISSAALVITCAPSRRTIFACGTRLASRRAACLGSIVVSPVPAM